jgi:site-specific recombinase XerD
MITLRFNPSHLARYGRLFLRGTRDSLHEQREMWRERGWAGDWVFPSHNTGERLTVSGVSQVLKRLKKRAGLNGRASPHRFRHRFAIDYLMTSGDLASLADLMGHESVETTKAFYAISEQGDLRRKHDQFSEERWKTGERGYI